MIINVKYDNDDIVMFKAEFISKNKSDIIKIENIYSKFMRGYGVFEKIITMSYQYTKINKNRCILRINFYDGENIDFPTNGIDEYNKYFTDYFDNYKKK